jgi:hypothetical protein
MRCRGLTLALSSSAGEGIVYSPEKDLTLTLSTRRGNSAQNPMK